MARLYGNENFSHSVVDSLRQLGHDVITVADTGKAEQAWPDENVLEFAVQDERAVLTLNRKHFIRLHRERPEHWGIIVCAFDPDFPGQSERIDAAIKREPRLKGLLIRVNRPPTSGS